MNFGLTHETAVYRPFPEHATPRNVLEFFADVFSSLDACPRRLVVEIDFSESGTDRPIGLDIERGEPVFRQAGARAAHGRFRGRWLAEHDVPMVLPLKSAVFELDPAGGNRIRVRSLRGGMSWCGRFWYTIREIGKRRM